MSSGRVRAEAEMDIIVELLDGMTLRVLAEALEGDVVGGFDRGPSSNRKTPKEWLKGVQAEGSFEFEGKLYAATAIKAVARVAEA